MTQPVSLHRPPAELPTARLRLRAWHSGDAPALLPLLEANHARLAPWIPARVATPAPLHDVAARLAEYERDFAEDRAYRYAVFPQPGGELVGEIDLFPRDASGRVALSVADRVEIGYWIDSRSSGHGLVTEAARAVLDVARALPRLESAEIRCDPRNAPSAAVPRRLGFTLDEVGQNTEVWRMPFDPV